MKQKMNYMTKIWCYTNILLNSQWLLDYCRVVWFFQEFCPIANLPLHMYSFCRSPRPRFSVCWGLTWFRDSALFLQFRSCFIITYFVNDRCMSLARLLFGNISVLPWWFPAISTVPVEFPTVLRIWNNIPNSKPWISKKWGIPINNRNSKSFYNKSIKDWDWDFNSLPSSSIPSKNFGKHSWETEK